MLFKKQKKGTKTAENQWGKIAKTKKGKKGEEWVSRSARKRFNKSWGLQGNGLQGKGG